MPSRKLFIVKNSGAANSPDGSTTDQVSHVDDEVVTNFGLCRDSLDYIANTLWHAVEGVNEADAQNLGSMLRLINEELGRIYSAVCD